MWPDLPHGFQTVIPAKAGIHCAFDGDSKIKMDSGFRRNDETWEFRRGPEFESANRNVTAKPGGLRTQDH